MRRLPLLATLVVAALVAPLPALAQTCQQACGAVSMTRAENPAPVQACMIRCEAARRFAAEPHEPVSLAPEAPQLPFGRPLAVVVPPPVQELRWGAVYAVPPPGGQVGLVAGQADRLAAHAEANRRCNGARDSGCRMLREFNDRCAAVAQARRARGILLTSHNSTFEIAAHSVGTGASLGAAESDALAACRAQPGLTCRIAVSACTE